MLAEFVPPPGLTDFGGLTLAAECLKTLAHPHRLRMVEMVLAGRYTVGELAAACGVPAAMASGHLRLMQRCGLLTPVRDGRAVYYAVADPCLAGLIGCVRKRFGANPSITPPESNA